MRLQELKSLAYDMLVQIDIRRVEIANIQNQLESVNQQIAELHNKEAPSNQDKEDQGNNETS